MAVIDVPTGPASGSSFGDTAGVSAGTTQAQGFRLSPQRSEQEVMLAWKMNELFQRAREARRNTTAQWNANYKTVYGRAPAQFDPRKSTKDVPEVFPILESMAAWMTDANPKFDVAPVAQPNSFHYAKMDEIGQDLKTCLNAAWDNQGFAVEIQCAVFDALTYHIGIAKAGWDCHILHGLGDVSLRRIDPFAFYIDPAAKHPRDANYMIEVRQMSIQDLERAWPGASNRIGGNAVRHDTDGAPDRMSTQSGSIPMANPGALYDAASDTTGSGRFGLPGQASIRAFDDIHGVTILECWIKVPVTVKLEEQAYDYLSAHDQQLAKDEQGLRGGLPGDDDLNPDPDDINSAVKSRGHDPDKDTVTYDIWRQVVVCGNTIISDKSADELYGHGEHPYEIYMPTWTGELYRPSMVELLSGLQDDINELLRNFKRNIALTGNPVLVETRTSGMRRAEVTAQPGKRYQVRDKEDLSWMAPPTIHPQVAGDLMSFLLGELERISGLSAIVRGLTPTGRNAEGVVDAAQEAAFVRIRMQITSLESFISRIGNKTAANQAEFYDRPRIIAVAPVNGEKTSLAIRSLHFYDPTPENRVPLRYQFSVNAGSANPTSRDAMRSLALHLFGINGIDVESLLQAVEWPNAAIVAERVKAQQMAEAQASVGARDAAHAGR